MAHFIIIISGLMKNFSDSIKQGDFGISIMSTNKQNNAMKENHEISEIRKTEFFICQC